MQGFSNTPVPFGYGVVANQYLCPFHPFSKYKIESSEKGKELLNKQYNIVKKLKSRIIEDTNREMDLFRKFKEYSKTNHNTSYEEFIKNNI